uniref:NAD-dependent protein deacylase n=1 Tax=Hirondellea gigas TaxID=1518452 RepID=A0A2P2I2G2_9CRUS
MSAITIKISNHCVSFPNMFLLKQIQYHKVFCKLCHHRYCTTYVNKLFSSNNSNLFSRDAASNRHDFINNISYSTLKYCSNLAFVPRHEPCSNRHIEDLQEFVDNSKKLFVLTGAGISTESGIPDYRSEGVGLYATSTKRPVQIKEFISNASVRQSYWARNYVGWSRFSSFKPNITHITLAQWEQHGKVSHIVTQNVDTLHQKAGSINVTELHGSLHDVRCMQCQYSISRTQFHHTLSSLNPRMAAQSQDIRPDGDVELVQDDVSRFVVPCCPSCGGFLKPHVVFFGDNVPRARVEAVKEQLRQSDALLALGSSLQVYSAYRFILYAAELKLPMAAVNIGLTRADAHLSLRVPARCGHVLPLITLR